MIRDVLASPIVRSRVSTELDSGIVFAGAALPRPAVARQKPLRLPPASIAPGEPRLPLLVG